MFTRYRNEDGRCPNLRGTTRCEEYPRGNIGERVSEAPNVYGWSYLDGSGEELGSSQRFPDPEAAEAWIGTSWQDLLENGIEEVVLIDHARERRLYRMGLGSE
jgi:hypothetical protein